MSVPAASRAIEQLAATGALAEGTGMQRRRVWIATAVLDVLDEYAASLRPARY
ncbi:hypothetical protein [Aeromicrobium massiliense]|uniref:hypothetical protein n=1 Tax=Aeromicrobium massiliense TaxID=1464554 RepID=UPI0002E0022D|nr:hypothetical protein [Aeromicrobium massiliense]